MHESVGDKLAVRTPHSTSRGVRAELDQEVGTISRPYCFIEQEFSGTVSFSPCKGPFVGEMSFIFRFDRSINFGPPRL